MARRIPSEARPCRRSRRVPFVMEQPMEDRSSNRVVVHTCATTSQSCTRWGHRCEVKCPLSPRTPGESQHNCPEPEAAKDPKRAPGHAGPNKAPAVMKFVYASGGNGIALRWGKYPSVDGEPPEGSFSCILSALCGMLWQDPGS